MSECTRCSGTKVILSAKKNEEGDPMELPCPESIHWKVAAQEARPDQYTLYVAHVDATPTLSTTPHEIAEPYTAEEVVRMWDAAKARIKELEGAVEALTQKL